MDTEKFKENKAKRRDECSSVRLRSWARKKDKGSDSPLGVHTHSGPGEQIEGRMTGRVNEYCQCTPISMSVQGWRIRVNNINSYSGNCIS